MGESSELPANIAGGSAASPSVTTIELFSDMACASLGEIVGDVSINLKINHTDIEDLHIRLVAPDGRDVVLLDHPCRNQDSHDLNVTFLDNTNNFTCNNNLNFALNGKIRPHEDTGLLSDGLSKFNGQKLQDLDGVWQLVVIDNDNSVGNGDTEVGQGEVEVANLQISSNFRSNYTANDCSDFEVSLLHEEITDLDCQSSANTGSTIVRVWQAEDAFGNISTCEQVISLQKPSLYDVHLPDTLVKLECTPTTGSGSIMAGLPNYDCNDILEEQHTYCDISYTFEDEVLELCGNTFKILRTWTLVDWCSGVTLQHEQTIVVEDTQAPVISLADTKVIPDTFSCTASMVVKLDYEDDCSPLVQLKASYTIPGGIHDDGTLVVVDLTNNDTIPNMPVGMTNVTFTAMDECGNIGTLISTLNPLDQIAPTALCYDTTGMNTVIPPIHLSVSSDGTAKVFAEDIDYGSFDNCGIAEVRIRRLEGCLETSAWGQEAIFDCCDEAFNPIILELEVIDIYNNRDTCQREIYVEDPIPPVILDCPENDTLICADIQEVVDAFQTPLFTDNCDAIPSFQYEGGINLQCMSGKLTKVWTISDLSPKSPDAQCSQDIVVLHNSDFIVQFPADTLIENCPNNLEYLGEPVIINDECELVATSYEDHIFDIVPDACYKIERHWTVVNWCVLNTNPTTGSGSIIPSPPGEIITLPVPRTFQDDNVGRIEYTQTIKVLDSQAPTFFCPSDTLICDASDACNHDILLGVPISDNCSTLALEYQYKIDLDNDGSFDIVAEQDTVSGVFPYGTHQIKWIAEDGCGNTSECSYLFTIQDCFPPTPVCLNGISTTTQTGNCTPVWASNLLEYATDNCTNENYLENSVKIKKQGDLAAPQHSILFCCEDVGTQIVEIWIEDEAGNQAFCSTSVLVQSNNEDCDTTNVLANIAGRIATTSGDWVENAQVQLDGNLFEVETSQFEGDFRFNNISMNENYTLRAQKTHDPLNGVSTFDLVLMTQHILGYNHLDSPYKMIAADINNDGNISTFDVVQLRQLILFFIQDFPNNTSWRFVDAAYVFPNPNNPWQEAFPEYIAYHPLTQNELAANFTGVKIGDVDGNAVPNTFVQNEERNPIQKTFSILNMTYQKDDIVAIPFQLNEISNLEGFQFSLAFDSTNLAFQDSQNGLINISYPLINIENVDNGLIHVSWNQNNTSLLNEETPLFELLFKAKSSGTLHEVIQLSNRHLQAEVYFDENQKADLEFYFEGKPKHPNDQFVLFQNKPNPFAGSTTIEFYTPQQNEFVLEIFSTSGQLVFQEKKVFPKGQNAILLDATIFDKRGVYYYRLSSGQASKSKSFIKL